MKTSRRDLARAGADTVMFLLRGDSPSGPRVGLLIHLNELPICEMGVLLRRRQRGVAEELLDCAEVGAGVQKVRCERMAQRVRRNSCSQRRLPNVAAEQSSNAANGDA